MNRMTAFLAQTFRSSNPPAAPVVGIAQQLMERAGSLAGHDRFEAQALRDAANAYLRVVR
jgi:hypothetical protein